MSIGDAGASEPTRGRLLIGVAGGTGAGKSTVVDVLGKAVAAWTRGKTSLVGIDAYYLDRSHLSPEVRTGLNYDEPDAFDVPLLEGHLLRLRQGQPVPKPRYSFASHSRVGVEAVTSAPVILVEGLLALWWPELRRLMDVKVYVDAPADLRLARRIRRDVTERGRPVESVLAQYLTTVRPMHERYVEPTKAHADLVVVNDGRLSDCVEQVEAAVRDRLSGVARR